MFVPYLSHAILETNRDVSYDSWGLEDEAHLFLEAICTKHSKGLKLVRNFIENCAKKTSGDIRWALSEIGSLSAPYRNN